MNLQAPKSSKVPNKSKSFPKTLKNCGNNTHDVSEEIITECNFIQGKIGNCGLVASMATLASNRDLYEKVVPRGQNFKTSSTSETKFEFNLYKLGKLHKVVVDRSLSADGDGLIFSRSCNDSLVGPLLEKAIVQLHYGGNYESTRGINATNVLSSFTDSFFEHHLTNSKDTHFSLEELISHGLKTKSQMVVSFKKSVKNLNLFSRHYYTLVDVKNNFVKLVVHIY